MPVEYKEKSPAKINLFLKIINKRKDNYHNIRSGITFINLYDDIIVSENDSFKIKYIGEFAPKNHKFDDCIIEKLFKCLKILKPNFLFTINKNIPTQAGLGSASSNAAAVLRILEKLNLYKFDSIEKISKIGADIPMFINQKDCLIRETGNIVINKIFPKYYFLLVKPNANILTKKIFNSLEENDFNYKLENDNEEINDYDIGNDFEKIIRRNVEEINIILNFLRDIQNIIFYRLTGSGSCCYGAFENIDDAINAQKKFKKKFPFLWSKVVENNLLK